MIELRIYLQIYIEHWRRLEPIRRRLPAPWVLTVAPLQNPLLRGFAGFVLYLLLPLTILAFTWKAAVLPAWGSGLFCVTAAAIVAHLTLGLRWPWWARALLTAEATVFAATIVYSEGPLSRGADLFRADLSEQWLPDSHLQGANLSYANLERANLAGADLTGAYLARARLNEANLVGARLAGAYLARASLSKANLTGASLTLASLAAASLEGANLEGVDLAGANLAGARLSEANLERAVLSEANLERADLSEADLAGADLANANLADVSLVSAKNLKQPQLDQACGDETTKLPAGFELGPDCLGDVLSRKLQEQSDRLSRH